VLRDGALVVSYSGRRNPTGSFTASSGVFLCTNAAAGAGAVWLDRSDANMRYWTKDVVVNPHEAGQSNWYAGVFNGWGGAANDKGGLYRSDDGGEKWTNVNSPHGIRQRAWYYYRVFADPVSADTVYTTNIKFHRSTDGGKSFSTIRVRHGDTHDLWIDPDDPRRMILADGARCHWCVKPATQADHLIETDRGGSDELDNLVPACAKCNARRGQAYAMAKKRFFPVVQRQIGRAHV
jgi:hypothetical protein